jgi:CheY-like chemotaxis protein
MAATGYGRWPSYGCGRNPEQILRPGVARFLNHSRAVEDAMQKVVIVNGTTDLLDMVQPVLTAGHYDVVFVESNSHAYSHIKQEKPSLIILCIDMHEREGFQVLSMLKLDQDTREIPLLTCLSEYELPAESTTFGEREFADDEDMLEAVPAATMN